MSDFTDKINGKVENYIDEIKGNFDNSNYKDIIINLCQKAIVRLFAERYATKEKKVNFKVDDCDDSVLDFMIPTRKVSKKLTKADIVRQLMVEVSDDKKEDLQSIIAEAGWLNAEQLETIE